MNAKTLSAVTAQDAALLSAAEIGLGSLLHAFRLPLSGQFLSLNQIFLLTRSLRKLRPLSEAWSAPLKISCVAALLKTLAPAGKKLTPMLAISAQGLLFSFGVALLGTNSFGIFLGAVLASFWAFFQPILIYLFLFGPALLEAGEFFLAKLADSADLPLENFLWYFLIALGLKALLACAAAGAALSLPESWVSRYFSRLAETPAALKPACNNSAGNHSPAAGALRDLIQPLFLFSLALTTLFFWFAESSQSQLIWALLRPLALGFVFFYLVRWLPLRYGTRLRELPLLRNLPLAGALSELRKKNNG